MKLSDEIKESISMGFMHTDPRERDLIVAINKELLPKVEALEKKIESKQNVILKEFVNKSLLKKEIMIKNIIISDLKKSLKETIDILSDNIDFLVEKDFKLIDKARKIL